MKNILSSRMACCYASILFSSLGFALPALDAVKHGEATVMQPDTSTLHINQVSDKAIVNWHSFNVDAQEKVHFQQAHANAVCLNRIDAANGMSQIAGQVTSNGRIALVNGAGILFSDTAKVNVGALVASATDIADENFINWSLKIDQGDHVGAIINQGDIHGEELVWLLGSNVVNQGTIGSKQNVQLLSGSKFFAELDGNDVIKFAVEPAVATATDASGNKLKNGIDISGKIEANTVFLLADAKKDIFDNLINTSGEIRAISCVAHEGSITLLGNQHGAITVNGKLDVSSETPRPTNGKYTLPDISISSNKIIIDENAILDASGDYQPGQIQLGSLHSLQIDSMKIPATDYVHVKKGAILDVTANKAGNGGDIDIEAKKEIKFEGTAKIFSSATSETGSNFWGGYLDITGLNSKTVIDTAGADFQLSSKDGSSKGKIYIGTDN